MQKLEILIEENAFGSVRPVEVVADAPISALVPALVEELRLPQTDLFGKRLVYMLRVSEDGRIIPDNTTLAAAGVQEGALLSLDSYVLDGSVAALEQRSPLPEPALYSSATIADAGPMPAISNESWSSRSSGSSWSSRSSGNSQPLRGSMSAAIVPPERNERRWGRRLFLTAVGTVLGLGGAGLGYAGYRAYTNGGLNSVNQLLGQKTGNSTAQTAAPPAMQPKTNLPTTANLALTFTQHTGDIRVVTWTADGKMLASAADDAHVFVWGTNGTVQRTIVHNAAVTALAWSPDGQRFVTGAGNRIAFYNLAGTLLSQSTHGHTQTIMSLAWAAHDQMQVVSGGADKQAVVWNPTSYQLERVYALHTSPINVVSWASDGQTVASSSQNGGVRVWSSGNGQDRHGYYQDTNASVRALAFAPTGMQLAIGGDDGIVRVWNNGLTCGNAGAICRDVPQRVQVSQTAIRVVSWSPDSRLLAVGADDGSFSIWNPAQLQKPLLKVTIQQGIAVHSITWSPDSKQIATASGHMVKLWTLA